MEECGIDLQPQAFCANRRRRELTRSKKRIVAHQEKLDALDIEDSRSTLRIRVFILFAIAATLAIVPMLVFGNSWGHDFDSIVPVWIDAAQEFAQGVVYPHWAASANGGFGEPFFLFYPPLSWGIGGALGSILPWKLVPGAYIWIVVFLACVAMWRCARDWVDPGSAVFAALLYALNPYILVMIYRRCSYAELLASAVFPLLLGSALRMGRNGRQTILPLAVVFAAIWLADLPAGVIASYALVLLLIVTGFLNRSARPILYGAFSIVIAFAGLAFFLLPAAWERKWVNMGLVVRPELAPEGNFLFGHQGNPLLREFNTGIALMGLFLILVTTGALLVTRRLRGKIPTPWYQLAALAGASAFLMFRPSLILWQILPQLRYVQFPWRWLSPLCAAGALLLAMAAGRTQRKWMPWTVAALTIAAAGVGIVHGVRWDAGHRHMDDLVAAIRSGAGYRENAEWSRPLGSDPSKLPANAPLVASAGSGGGESATSPGVEIRVRKWLPEHKVFSVSSARADLLRIKLLAYPAWVAKVNGAIVPIMTDGESGQMLLAVPPGVTQAEVTFGWTRDRAAGAVLSLITVLAVVPALWLFAARSRPIARQSNV
jgi:hypothetical protein